MNSSISLNTDYDIMERGMSLLYMEIKDLQKEKKESNHLIKIKIKFYQYKLEIAEKRIRELEKENIKIKKQLRPNIIKRIINKIRGYKKI